MRAGATISYVSSSGEPQVRVVDSVVFKAVLWGGGASVPRIEHRGFGLVHGVLRASRQQRATEQGVSEGKLCERDASPLHATEGSADGVRRASYFDLVANVVASSDDCALKSCSSAPAPARPRLSRL